MAIGMAIWFLLLLAKVQIENSISVLLMLPMIIDGTTQLLGMRQSNNSLRFLTGISFAIGFAQISYAMTKAAMAILL